MLEKIYINYMLLCGLPYIRAQNTFLSHGDKMESLPLDTHQKCCRQNSPGLLCFPRKGQFATISFVQHRVNQQRSKFRGTTNTFYFNAQKESKEHKLILPQQTKENFTLLLAHSCSMMKLLIMISLRQYTTNFFEIKIQKKLIRFFIKRKTLKN
jgi:hypothetical protein